jgi:ABC-type transport system involved in multi-copper enzyme maturation permease subunit
MRGEFLKITRLFWFLFAILLVGFLLALLLQGSVPGLNVSMQHTPLHFLYDAMENCLTIFRILSGFFLLILTSYSIGREYQYGTIRILLARGVGRVQLLLAKMALIVLIGLLLLVLFALISAIFTCLLLLTRAGNLNALQALTSDFWLNTGRDLLAVMISMGATILLATAMNTLGRSLTFGLSASLVWFPLDNIGSAVMNEVAELTHSNFWREITPYLLGPLLNRLPDMLLPEAVQGAFASFGVPAQVPVGALQALLVICAYSIIFLTAALVSTWKRDVKE